MIEVCRLFEVDLNNKIRFKSFRAALLLLAETKRVLSFYFCVAEQQNRLIVFLAIAEKKCRFWSNLA